MFNTFISKDTIFEKYIKQLQLSWTNINTPPCLTRQFLSLCSYYLDKFNAWLHLYELHQTVQNRTGREKWKMKIYVSSGMRTQTRRHSKSKQASETFRWRLQRCLNMLKTVKVSSHTFNINTPLTIHYLLNWLWFGCSCKVLNTVIDNTVSTLIWM